MSNSTTIRFDRERETKNTVRFAEVVKDGETPKIGTLYLHKSVEGVNDAKSVDVEIRVNK